MKIKESKKELITLSNPEWKNIHDLSLEVQNNFLDNESLSIPVYHRILDWKLHNKRSQIKKIIEFSPDTLVKTITQCYCKADHPDEEMKTRIRMHVLLSIPWIGFGIASAIMALHKPQLYGSIDSRSWNVLYRENKKAFSIKEYLKYLGNIRELAARNECNVLEMEYILWKQFGD